MTPTTTESRSPLRIDYRIDLGHIITFAVLIVGFAIQYGSLSTRLTAVEVQAAKATATNESLNITLHSLETTIIKVQTQMDEREKRFDNQAFERDARQAAAQSAQNIREDRKKLQATGIPK
jgi:uncharacterized coiled-coil protein SlyX